MTAFLTSAGQPGPHVASVSEEPLPPTTSLRYEGSAMDFSTDYAMTIGGKAVITSRTIDVVNPATGKMFTTAPDAGVLELDNAVAAARAAQHEWKSLGIGRRRELLIALSKAIVEHAEGFTQLFVREQGRPAALASREILRGASWLEEVARQDLPVEIAEDSASRRVEVHHEPLGVVAAIVPWNFPFLLAIWKIAPALLVGNTMVLKPSPFTPLCALKLGELARGILPPGVFNVISGGDSLGPLMTAHPGFSKISFTGSTATGKRVMEAAARDLKRVTLELGGNDAAIVLPDVNLEKIAQKIFFGAFYNSAQICIATKRLYIHESIYDALRDRLAALAKATIVGDGNDPTSGMGPLQNAPQYRRVKALIEEAREQGLVLIEGRAVPADGYFIPVTLVDNPPDDARVVTEEAFGPVLPLLKFSDVDEVIRRSNDSQYGLAGAVWSANIDRALAVARRMETGTVWINDNLQNAPHIPFAGFKQSGVGVENGREGLLEFTQPKTIFVPKAADAVS
jgi:acyl-CoA reductase-like NAD-dependent aldehyde dehydrogenase